MTDRRNDMVSNERKQVSGVHCDEILKNEKMPMIAARIQYFGSFGSETKRTEESVEIADSATVLELLRKLSSQYGATFENEIFQADQQELRDDMIIAVNGALLRHTSVLATKLHAGDTIALLPMFPGGG